MNQMDQLVSFLSEKTLICKDEGESDDKEKKDKTPPQFAKKDKGKEDDGKGMDKPGEEDSDVDNDGDSDESDDFLKKRREGKAGKEDKSDDKGEDKDDENQPDKDRDDDGVDDKNEMDGSDSDDDGGKDKDSDDDDYTDEKENKKPKGKKDKVEMKPVEDEKDDVVEHTAVMESISFLFADQKRERNLRENDSMEQRKSLMKAAMSTFQRRFIPLVPRNANPEQMKHIRAIIKSAGPGAKDKDIKTAIDAVMKNVSEENLDELNKKTLSNYIGKAAVDATSRAYDKGAKSGKHKDDSIKKIFKRTSGIDLASKKLTKEETVNEMSDSQKNKAEEIVTSMKSKKKGFEKRYGDKAENVMYATANKLAQKEGFELTQEMFTEGYFVEQD